MADMADDQHEASRDVAKQESGGPVAPEPEEHTETQGASFRSDDAAASGAAASGDASPDNTPLAHDGPQQEASGAAPTYAGEKIGLFSGRKNDFSEKYHLTRRGKLKRLDQIIRIANQFDAIHGLTPVKMRLMFEALGPTFVKVGQILSMRSEILPQSFCDELAKLRANADPMPYQTVLDTLSHEYGKPVKDIFKSIDSTPLGSASLAQVHRATLVTGQDVAVKVQRPGVRETMAQDVSIMRTIARSATKIMHNAQVVDFQGVVEELWDTFESETDFLVEARNLQEFKRFCSRFAYMDCPKPYMDLCTEHVVVMDYIDGISLSHPGALVAKGYDLKEIGTKLVDNYATQVLDEGFFHADPHPGNMLVRDGKIVYIDLGMMGRLSPRDRAGFGSIINAVGMQSASELKDALLAFAIQRDNNAIDHTRFLADLDLLLKDYGSCDVSAIDVGQLLSDILNLTRQCKVTLPPSITSVSRGIVTLEGTVMPLIPNENMVSIINAHIQRTKDTKAELISAMQELALALRAAGSGTLDTAKYAGQALHMLTRGQVKVNMEVLGSEAPMRSLSIIINRLSLGIIVAGLFIGSSMVALSTMEPRVLGVPVLSFFGYLGALVLSIWVVTDILRKRR